MRIAYLAPSAVPSAAANAVHVMRMCGALAGLGHETTLLAPAPPGEAAGPDPFAYYGLPAAFELERVPRMDQRGSRWRYLWATWAYNRRMVRRLRELRPDLIYSRHLPGAWAAARAGFEVVYEAHQTVWDARLEGRMLRGLLASPQLRRLVVISEALKALFLAHTPAREERILVLPDAADPTPADTEPAPLPGRPGALRLGYVGSLLPGRGVELLAELARRLPEADLHLVGGSADDLARLRALAPPENLLVHGRVAPAQVPGLLLACHVLLAPYQRSVAVHGGGGDTAAYCSPLKIFEYMGSGRPMIVSDLPVFREVLDESVARLAPPDDVEAWVAAVRDLADPARREALARAAQARFLARHTWTRRARAALDAL